MLKSENGFTSAHSFEDLSSIRYQRMKGGPVCVITSDLRFGIARSWLAPQLKAKRRSSLRLRRRHSTRTSGKYLILPRSKRTLTGSDGLNKL